MTVSLLNVLRLDFVVVSFQLPEKIKNPTHSLVLVLPFENLSSSFIYCCIYACVCKSVCLHLGVMICEIIYCPSQLESLRNSSLLSKPVIPHSQHKKYRGARAPRPSMHKTLLPHKNTYAVSVEETQIHHKHSLRIMYLDEKIMHHDRLSLSYSSVCLHEILSVSTIMIMMTLSLPSVMPS